MATKTKRKPAKKAKAKAKQPFLEGMEPPRIKAIDEAAEIYHDAKMDRVKLSKDEDEAKDNLIDLMKQHDIALYETPDGLIVSLLNKSNVKTKKKTIGGVEGEHLPDDE
jgi:hypothetical protein